MTIEDQLKDARKLCHTVGNQLDDLETGRETSDEFKGQVSSNVNKLTQEIKYLEAGIINEEKEKREVIRRQVQRLSEDTTSHRIALDRFLTKLHSRAVEQRQREELLGGSSSSSGNSSLSNRARASRRENDSLVSSKRVMDEVLGRGSEVVNMLFSQRQSLLRARRKALDIAGTLGISNSLLGVMERRNLVDKWFVWAGMLLTILVLWYLFL